MPTKLNKVDNKASLEAYKDKLVKEIYYYDKKIGEARSNLANKPRYLEDEVSSDSDSELSLVIDTGPSLLQLKTQQAMLKTCLQATQELTNLEVLESEVNVLVQEPTFEGESPITTPGTWQEVMADCCVDLVPFNITFYAHRGEGKFAPVSYRGLRVMPLKSSHEIELVKSILPDLRRPSDAVEVMRSYAVAHRSRRSTLARLADKFGAALFMEPKESGGYLLKCANVLEVSWTLQNKWSPIAPFHHRLKFDLEYMDESYIKTITQAHRQLSDPSVDTDERTLLLARIIGTCLAARPLEPDSSDQEPADVTSPHKPPDKRRTTLDREPDVPNMKRKKDSEVMAPPKTVPKKVKPKVKSPSENTIANPKPSKRLLQDDKTNDDVKKPKLNNNIQDDPKNEVNNETEAKTVSSKTSASNKNNARSVSGKSKKEKSVVNSKSEEDKINVGADEINENIASKMKNQANTQKAGKKEASSKKTANTENKTEMQAATINGATSKSKVKNIATKNSTVTRNSMSNVKTDSEKLANPKASRNSAPPYNHHKNMNDKKSFDKNNVKNTKTVKSAGSAKKSETIEKQVTQRDGNVIKIVKNITNEKGEVVKKVVKKLASDKPKVTEKVSAANELKPASKLKTNLPKKANVINKVSSSGSVKKTTNNAEQVKKPLHEQNNKISKTANQGTLKKDTKNPTKVPSSTAIIKKTIPGSIKKTATSGIEKENTAQNKIITSKIPQKKMASPKSVIKKMPNRISPRKSIIKSKPPLAGANLKKIVQKSVTGIPRLLTKPRPKVM